MADDTPLTIEDLKQRILSRRYRVYEDELDALIAAVRAENAEQIAQMTLQLETYQAKFVSDGQEILRLKRLTGS